MELAHSESLSPYFRGYILVSPGMTSYNINGNRKHPQDWITKSEKYTFKDKSTNEDIWKYPLVWHPTINRGKPENIPLIHGTKLRDVLLFQRQIERCTTGKKEQSVFVVNLTKNNLVNTRFCCYNCGPISAMVCCAVLVFWRVMSHRLVTVLVTDGDLRSLQAALWHGKPSVVLPTSPDQVQLWLMVSSRRGFYWELVFFSGNGYDGPDRFFLF